MSRLPTVNTVKTTAKEGQWTAPQGPASGTHLPPSYGRGEWARTRDCQPWGISLELHRDLYNSRSQVSPIGSSCAGGEAQGLVYTRQSPSLSHTSSTIKLLTNQRQRKEPLREMKRKTTEKTNFLDNRFLIPNYVNQRKRYKNCESRILYPVKKKYPE